MIKNFVDFILRCIELREKLTSKTRGEIEYNEVFVSRLFLRNVERGLKSNLILHEIRLALRSHGETTEEILSATKRGPHDERDRARNFSKRSTKVNRVIGDYYYYLFIYR